LKTMVKVMVDKGMEATTDLRKIDLSSLKTFLIPLILIPPTPSTTLPM
jgi:hypothetical protein